MAKNGKTFWARILQTALLVALFALTVQPADAAKRLALVIGNDTYEDIEPLSRAVADARAYRHTLEDERGFKVFYAENAGRRAMNTTVANFLAAITPGDTAMIVYSGHGVQLDSERRDSLYLLPIDFPNRDPGRGAEQHFFDSESLNFARLAEHVAARGAKLRIFVLDACRNNPFNRENGTRAIGQSRGIGRITSSRGEFVIYAAAPGEVAFDSLPGDDANSVNSLFTRAFIKHFRSGTYLEDVANDVQAEVVKLARAANVAQEPYYSDGVAGRTCLEENCGAVKDVADAKIVAEQEELYWKYCAENSEPLYCRAFIEQYPDSWRVTLAKARLKVLADEAKGKDTRTAAVGGAEKSGGVGAPADNDGKTIRKEDGDFTSVAKPTTDDGKNVSPALKSTGASWLTGQKDADKDAPGNAADGSDTAADTDKSAKDGDTDFKTAAVTPDGPATDTRDAGTDTPDTGNTDAETVPDIVPKTGAGATTDSETDTDPVDTRVAAVDPDKVERASLEPIRLTRDQLRDAQARLTMLGYRLGGLDGRMGKRTRSAIREFQREQGVEANGVVSEDLMVRLAAAVPDDKLAAYWTERAEADRARAERNRAAREEEARKRAERREARRRDAAERRTNTRTRTREVTNPTRTGPTAAERAAAKRREEAERRRVAEAKRKADAQRRAAAEARRRAEANKPGIKLKTRDRRPASERPFYCNANPERAQWDENCQ